MLDEYIALDLETTGINPVTDRILEIGAVHVKNNIEVGTFSKIINPRVPVPYRITELTGITQEMADNGSFIEDIFPDFLAFCGNLPLLGHNILFDYSFLKTEAQRQGVSYERDAVDTLRIAKKLLPELHSRKLTALCIYYGIDPGSSHRAFDDARSAHHLYQKLKSEFPEADDDIFGSRQQQYKPKKTSPITPRQKGYLNDLVKYHRINLTMQIDTLSKSEASRLIDKIILEHGRILK